MARPADLSFGMWGGGARGSRSAAWNTGLPSGWAARVGIQYHLQPGDRFLIVFPAAAHIADPGREIRHGDELVIEPGEIGEELQVHHPSLTLRAGYGLGGSLGSGRISRHDN